ncbi:MAG: lysylphosphatidylglycerol synthase transmembrane domain-containing protein [Albidovulum sp.]
MGSALFLGALFWFLPRDAIIAGFSRISFGLFLGVLAIFFLGHVAAAAKWWLLLGRGIPFGVAIKAHFAGLAANLCLPGAVGGDAVRAGIAHVAMRDGPKMAAGAVADRMIDMVALAFLAMAGALALRGSSNGLSLAIESGGVLVGLLILSIYALPVVVQKAWDTFPRLPARGLATKVAQSFADLGRKPGLLLATLLMSITIQGIFVCLSIRLALAVGVDIPDAAWFFAWPLAKIIAVLPISLGGLGVRESSLAALLVPYGAQAAQVVAAGLVWQAVLFAAGATGAIILMLSGSGLRPAKMARQKSEG